MRRMGYMGHTRVIPIALSGCRNSTILPCVPYITEEYGVHQAIHLDQKAKLVDVLGLVGLKTMAGGAVKVSQFSAVLQTQRSSSPHEQQTKQWLFIQDIILSSYIRIPTVASWTSFIAIDQLGFHASFWNTGAVLVATPRKDKMDKRLGYWARVVSRAGFTGVFGSDDQVPKCTRKEGECWGIEMKSKMSDAIKPSGFKLSCSNFLVNFNVDTKRPIQLW